MPRRPRFSSLLGVAVLLAPLLALQEGASTAAPSPLPRRAVVEVVFCLDTTGSMSALLAAAKLKFWAICSEILNGRPSPDLKVRLVAFRDIGDDYLTRVYDIRDDVDAVYADLQTFAANGGGDTPEHVNQALYDSVHKISRSTDRHTIRLIFLVGDAPPHMDYADDVKYPVTCQKALSAGILINAIQCGEDKECTRFCKDISEKANGAYAVISQNRPQKVTTAFDKRLAEINSELARTATVFGDARKRG